MIFTVDEINRDPVLLPNITLGYLVADTCLAEGTTLSAALALVTGQEETLLGAECSGIPMVPVIIGDARSSASIVVADTLGVFNIPMVGYLYIFGESHVKIISSSKIIIILNIKFFHLHL